MVRRAGFGLPPPSNVAFSESKPALKYVAVRLILLYRVLKTRDSVTLVCTRRHRLRSRDAVNPTRLTRSTRQL